MQHPYFTTETDLVDAVANKWCDDEALKESFKTKLIELFDSNDATVDE